MLLNLKILAKSGLQQRDALVQERLPQHVKGPALLHCEYQVNTEDNFYRMDLKVDAQLSIVCQRCMNEFIHSYQHISQLGISSSEEIAENIMSKYECIVSNNQQIDLIEVLTDELILYAPEFHLKLSDCDDEIKKLITIDE